MNLYELSYFHECRWSFTEVVTEKWKLNGDVFQPLKILTTNLYIFVCVVFHILLRVVYWNFEIEIFEIFEIEIFQDFIKIWISVEIRGLRYSSSYC